MSGYAKISVLAKRDFARVDRSRVAHFQEAQRRAQIERSRPRPVAPPATKANRTEKPT
jgi:hypothetical protein